MASAELSLVHYYLRSGYHRHAQTVCNELLKTRSNDVTMLFWRAVAMLKEGQAAEAVRELEGLMRRADAQMQLPIKIALVHSHRACKVVDQEALAQLETSLMSDDPDSAPDRARLTAAQLFWHLGESFDAKQHLQAILRLQPQSVPALALSGWLELAAAENEINGVKFASEWGVGAGNGDPSEEFEAAGLAFDQATAAAGGKRDLDTSMGLAKLAQMKESHREALDHLSQVIGTYAWFLPALVEKALVLLAMGDWEQAVETAQRALSQADTGSGRAAAGTIDALKVIALYSLSQESNLKGAASKISELSHALDRHEPMNAPLYFHVARPFARLSGRSPQVLSLTLALIEKACRLQPQRAEYAAEHAYQLMLLEDYQTAHSLLRRATSMEEGADVVMIYQIRCLILMGELGEAEQQALFASDMIGRPNPEMMLNEALLAARKLHDQELATSHLDRALESHMKVVKSLPHDADYFVKLNPDFLLEVGREYLRHCAASSSSPGGGPVDESTPAALMLSRATKLLHVVAKEVPGLLDGQLLLAKAHYLRGDFDSALRCCVQCNKVDPSFATAALLHAQILLQTERFRQADAVIEQVLAHNFGVREAPLFQLIKARVLISVQKQYAEAEQLLSSAIKKLPPPTAAQAAATAVDDIMSLSPDDRCGMHVCLVEAYLAQGKITPASQAMSKAVFEFAGTPQEAQLTIANAKVEVEKGEVETAITLLGGIGADSPHYHAARRTLADLYLHHRNDRRMFAECHEEMAKTNPTVSSFLQLGEAYMKMSEPSKAIDAFERANRLSPKDAQLASRIGQVLVSTHEYAKAVKYYDDAVRSDPNKSFLRFELAKLYYELGRMPHALGEVEKLAGALDGANGGGGGDGAGGSSAAGGSGDTGGGGAATLLLEDQLLVTKVYVLLSKIKRSQNQPQEVLDALLKAKANQAKALNRMRAGDAGGVGEMAAAQELMGDVCVEVAAEYERGHEFDEALAAYQQGVKFAEQHEPTLAGMARLQLRNGDLDAAQAQCSALMAVARDSTEGQLLLADIMLSKSEWDPAIYHLEQMLAKEPASYATIAKAIQLLRRAGRLEEAPKKLKDAEKSDPRAPLEPGFRYCQGLLARFQNNPRVAMARLNTARRDGEWGEAALTSMIEIYLNPENETNWDEMNIDGQVEPSDAVRAADKLLQELPPSPRREVLSCYTLMAYRMRKQIETAAALLLELLATEKDYVPALVCLSQAYLMLNQAAKARNHLKRVAKLPFSAEMVDDFERGWLILADVYINGGKYDLAEELCWRCLASNKSCAKAWEFLGVIKEKEMSYRDAAAHYEKAWSYESEASASVGYKLSFNYLKAKKYVEAIDVCHKVLHQFPDYPQIKDDVLVPARQALKP